MFGVFASKHKSTNNSVIQSIHFKTFIHILNNKYDIDEIVLVF